MNILRNLVQSLVLMKNNARIQSKLISAYYLNIGKSSEIHITFNILHKIVYKYHLFLMTLNNKKKLLENTSFINKYHSVYIIRYELLKFLSYISFKEKFFKKNYKV